MSTVNYTWENPKYSEYCELWSNTDWPLINQKDYHSLIKSRRDFIIARDANGHFIGMARLLSDYCQYAYIQDVLVCPKMRKIGIGTQLIQRILTKISATNVTFVALFSTKEGLRLYGKAGFSVPVKEIALILKGDV